MIQIQDSEGLLFTIISELTNSAGCLNPFHFLSAQSNSQCNSLGVQRVNFIKFKLLLHKKLSLQQLYKIEKVEEKITFGLLLSLLFINLLFINFTRTKDFVMIIIDILVL